jgi:hypothetical protein
VVDGGAMRNVADQAMWERHSRRLGLLSPSGISLQVTNNHSIPPEGQWTGITDLAGIKVTQSFEVMEAHSAFQVILGKLW